MPENNQQFLNLIKALRFPLIIIVLFCHSLGFEFNEVRIFDFSSENIYNFITQMISHNYADIAVSLFFFISGFLFFRERADINPKWFLSKWHRRVHTLLIPYILWNILFAIAIVLKNIIFSIFGHYDASEMGIISFSHMFQWFTIPLDFPLWYLKDLMIMSLLTPILYIVCRKLHYLGLAIFFAIYLFLPSVPFVSMRAISFFSIGCYLAIWKVDIMDICRKVKIPAHILATALLLLATFNNSLPYHERLLRLFYPFGMISFINIFDSICSTNAAKSRLEILSGSVFFIYAAHEIYILGWTKGILLRLLGEDLPAMYVRYCLVPVIVLFVCIMLHRLFAKRTPKIVSVMCGNRLF